MGTDKEASKDDREEYFENKKTIVQLAIKTKPKL
jgi:hypothetical protein